MSIKMLNLLSLIWLFLQPLLTWQFQRFNSGYIKIESRRKSISLNMVFDFIKKRSEEGLSQVQNIATKTMEGKLGEALSDSADYIKKRQKIDAENFKKLSLGLSKSRERLLSGISSAFNPKEDVGLTERLENLENILLQADIGSATTNKILTDLRNFARVEKLREDDILPLLRARLVEALTVPVEKRGLSFSPNPDEPTVIFVIGANGMGKTTTIGKIASRLQKEANVSVLLGACDTFRAAAVEQLNQWAIRANVSIEMPTENENGGSPVPVVKRTIERAKKEKSDVVIIDTSGRLSNNFELIEQLQEMKKCIETEIPGAPHETLLVVDGSVGRNAVVQAEAWVKYVGVSGLAVTKLDGTARGGFVVSIVKELGLPVKFIGVGEKIDDLRDFEPNVFIDALLGENTGIKNSEIQSRVNKILQISAAQQIEDFSKNESAAGRLRSSFAGNENSEVDKAKEIFQKPESAKPKRAKRPKPAAMKKKKK